MPSITALILALVLGLASLIPAQGVARAAASTTPAEAGNGSITVRIVTCDPATPPSGIARAHCTPTDRIPGLQVFELGSGANLHDINEADARGNTFTWSGLPDGNYVLNARDIPVGFDRFLVPGLNGLNTSPENGFTASPNEGYLIPMDSEHGRTWSLNVYLIRDNFAFDLGFRFWRCPAGVTAQPDMTRLGCKPILPPDDFAIDVTPLDLNSGDPTGEPAVTLDSADRADPSRPVLRSLRPGPWRLSGTPSEDLFGFAMRSSDPRLLVVLEEDRSGYMLAVAPRPGGVAQIDVYLLTAPE